jgi:glutaredoxin
VVEKAVALKNLVKEKSAVAVSTVLRRLSGKSDEAAMGNFDDEGKDISDISEVNEAKLVSEKPVEKSAWNPLNYIKKSSDVDAENKTGQKDSVTDGPPLPIALKGRIILYTKLGCQESKIFRLFLRTKRLRYVEINIDVYPGRKMELEKISGSTSVPKLFFNEICIGGLSELKNLDESGKLDEKIDFLITEAPLFETPSPPFSGEDDISSTGAVDELALIARKMKESIIVKDRLYKMRRFTNCFLGSDALDFLSEDQYLERQEVSLSRASYHHI